MYISIDLCIINWEVKTRATTCFIRALIQHVFTKFLPCSSNHYNHENGIKNVGNSTSTLIEHSNEMTDKNTFYSVLYCDKLYG